MSDAFVFAANAVLPIVLIILSGYLLKRLGLLGKQFLDEGNRLVFRVLLPALLFYNVYGIKSLREFNVPFVFYGIIAVLVIFAADVAVTCVFRRDNAVRGALIQAIFRSNYAIIGLPLAEALFGEKGAAAAGVMSAFCVPLFNILGVVTLTIFNGSNEKGKIDVKKILLGVLKNPLIIGVVLGLFAVGIRELFASFGLCADLKALPFLYKTLESVKSICTPLALLVLGGKFEFSAVPRLFKEILYGTLIRTVAVPVLGLAGAYILSATVFPQIAGEHFASYVGVFATPAAVASAVMAKEMGADGELAGQLVVWTTIVSTFTIFIYVMILRSIGIF